MKSYKDKQRANPANTPKGAVQAAEAKRKAKNDRRALGHQDRIDERAARKPETINTKRAGGIRVRKGGGA